MRSALIDTSADLQDAIVKVVACKSFDYGTVCSSEQAIVAEESLRTRILPLLEAERAFIANVPIWRHWPSCSSCPTGH
jgi:acetaldehyde dehydrogenase (acetylating)